MAIDVLERDDLRFPRSLPEFQRLLSNEAACAFLKHNGEAAFNVSPSCSIAMRHALVSLFAVLALSSQCYAVAVPDTPPYEFVQEFVRELVETHQGEELANRDLAAISKGADRKKEILISIVLNGTRTKLKLNDTIARLQQMHLARKGFDTLIPYLVEMYTRKVKLYDEFVQASQTMIAGPKPGID